MFINESYFTGPLEIAQLGQGTVVSKLRGFITENEPIVLEAALGYDFYLALKTAYDDLGSDDELATRWTELLDGVAFANVSGIRKKFAGLKSALAGFIYYEYMVDLHKQTTGIGVVKSKSENAEPASPNNKLADAWNKAAREIDILWEFLQAKNQETPAVYPEYKPEQVNNNSYWNGNPSFNSSNYMNPLF